MRKTRLIRAVLYSVLLSSSALGQSLFERGPTAAEGTREGAEGAATVVMGPMPLDAVSLMAIEPPKPRTFVENDLVTIIISERSQTDRNAKYDEKKEYDNSFQFTEFMDLIKLLELVWQPTSAGRLPSIDLESDIELKSKGTYQRQDRITDRITAKVLEVKPNGTMVVEARRSFTSDAESTTVTLSGVCRSEDVSEANTIQSNQLFDLVLNVQNSGEIRRATRKGLIPRVIETLFNF